ncbi:hypothetical protein BDZ97DRAFT_1760445 [Flammula alnicola]|nr:hypothetical protein BDZ97DRAFT_1760445 [Flammula alnicola]
MGLVDPRGTMRTFLQRKVNDRGAWCAYYYNNPSIPVARHASHISQSPIYGVKRYDSRKEFSSHKPLSISCIKYLHEERRFAAHCNVCLSRIEKFISLKLAPRFDVSRKSVPNFLVVYPLFRESYATLFFFESLAPARSHGFCVPQWDLVYHMSIPESLHS